MKIENLVLLILFFTIKLLSCDMENKMRENGLIDLADKDSNIKVEIINATTNNMLGTNSYGCLDKCFLQPETAKKLIKAQKELDRTKKGYRLKILEGTRPRSVQRRMYEEVKNKGIKKFVADPNKGSMHNYGTAVDVTIIDNNGKEIGMGKPDPRIKIINKSEIEIKLLLLLNIVNDNQKQNRALLKKVMTTAGFSTVSYEWWHFDSFPKEFVRNHFKIIE